MKPYTIEKLKIARKADRVIRIIRYLRYIFLPFVLFIRYLKKSRPDYFLVDGYLIGDTVLLRAFAKAIIRKSSNSYYMGGSQCLKIMEDINIMKIINLWPWASKDYSIKNIFQQIRLAFIIFYLQPKIVIEFKGDLRSLLVIYLAYPEKIAGYSFTGGKFLIDIEPDVEEGYFHLEEHNRRLAETLGLDYRRSDIKLDYVKKRNIRPRIGLSFSGSQPLRRLPLNIARKIIDYKRFDKMEIIYLKAPKDYFLEENDKELGLNIWEGGFAEYFAEMKQLDGLITMDSGGAHIAGMLSIPSIVVFGTINSYIASPVNADAFPLENNNYFYCRPCNSYKCINNIFQFCYQSIKEKDIYDTMDKFIGRIESNKNIRKEAQVIIKEREIHY